MVSIIIPMQEHRKAFWQEHCAPTIELMRNGLDTELIMIDGLGTAPVKRNKGAAQAKGKYLLFVDDDIAFPDGWLSRVWAAIEANQGADIAYTDYNAVVANKAYHPSGSHKHVAMDWSFDTLKRRNYICTTSLIRASAFPGFDESIKRFQDWDLWLNMGFNGSKGVYVKNNAFTAYYNDLGISSKSTDPNVAKAVIQKKWKLTK